jgi:hypothetical protein
MICTVLLIDYTNNEVLLLVCLQKKPFGLHSPFYFGYIANSKMGGAP